MKKHLLTLSFLASVLITAQAQVPTQGLVASYAFDGNYVDATANANTFTAVGPAGPGFVASGLGDQSVKFNGDGGLVSSKSFSNQNFAGTAISVWIKRNGSYVTASNVENLLQGAYIGFGLNLSSGTNQVSTFFDGSSAGALSASTNHKIDDNKWHHIVAQNNGTKTSLYIDGILTGSQNETLSKMTAPNANAKLYISKNLTGVNFFYGELNTLKIYDRALTDCEVDELYKTGPFATTASYNFNNNADDQSGNGNNLTASGVTYTADGTSTVATFNGTGGFETTSNFNISDADQQSISGWIKVGTTPTTENKFIAQGANIGFGLYVEQTTGKLCAFFDGTSAGAAKTPTSIVDNKWHYFTAVNNGASTAIFIDGEMKVILNDILANGSGATNEKMFIGRNSQNTQMFVGQLEDLTIHKNSLSECYIDSVFALGAPGSIVTNVIDSELRKDVYIASPNPVENIMTISGTDIQLVEIYSILGQKMLTSNASQVDLSQLASGLYIVVVQTSTGKVTQKVYKK